MCAETRFWEPIRLDMIPGSNMAVLAVLAVFGTLERTRMALLTMCLTTVCTSLARRALHPNHYSHLVSHIHTGTDNRDRELAMCR